MTAHSQLLFTGGYGAVGQPGLRAFIFDTQDGSLTDCGQYTGVQAPSYVAVHPTGRWLYAVSETGLATDHTAGHVHALSLERTGDSVNLTPLNVQPSGGDFPCHLLFDPTGRWLIVSNYGSGTVQVLPIQVDGSLGNPGELIRHHGHGTNPERQEGPHAHSAIFTPDGHFVIVADLGIDTLVVYRFADGRLTKTADVPTTAGAGPRHMAFDHTGKVLYVTNELNGTLSAYNYDHGALSTAGTYPTVAEELAGNLVADLHLSPDGRRLFVSNRGDNSLIVFAAGPEGKLTALKRVDCGGNWPRNFCLSPDGDFLLVANQYSGEVVSLPVHPGAGEIGAPVAHTPVPTVSCVTFAPEFLDA